MVKITKERNGCVFEEFKFLRRDVVVFHTFKEKCGVFSKSKIGGIWLIVRQK